MIKIKTLVLSILLASCLSADLIEASSLETTPPQPSSLSESKETCSKKEIKFLIIETLQEHPELVLDALQKAIKEEEKKALQEIETRVQTLQGPLFKNNNPIVGNPKGDIKIAAFFDYQCSFCKKSDDVLQEILKTDPNVSIIYHPLPILGPHSHFLAQLILAADRQGLSHDLHRAFIKGPKRLNQNEAFEIAQKKGINIDQL